MRYNKGIILAIVSCFLIAASFPFAQYILEAMSPAMFALSWFAAATALSLLFFWLKERKSPLRCATENWKEGIAIGMTNASSAFFWSLSIKMIGSSLTAFFLRFITLFIIILGIMFLKEKLNRLEMAGAGISIAGALLISYRSDASLQLGMLFAMLCALTGAVSEFLGKVYVARISPFGLSVLRTSYSMLFLFILAAATAKIMPVPARMLPFIIAGCLLSAVLGFLLYYMALQTLTISKAAIIRTMEPFIVITYAFLIFRELPTSTELVGGALIVLGVLISIANFHPVMRGIKPVF